MIQFGARTCSLCIKLEYNAEQKRLFQPELLLSDIMNVLFFEARSFFGWITDYKKKLFLSYFSIFFWAYTDVYRDGKKPHIKRWNY